MNGYQRVAHHPNINNVVDVINSGNETYVFYNPGVRMLQANLQEKNDSDTGVHVVF